MAHKPHERYATAAEAAEALQNLIRPRAKPVVAPKESLPVAPERSVPAAARAAPAEPVASPVPVVEKLVAAKPPNLPGWFQPLSRLAEHRPRTTFFGIVLTLLAVFSAGVAAGYVMAR